MSKCHSLATVDVTPMVSVTKVGEGFMRETYALTMAMRRKFVKEVRERKARNTSISAGKKTEIGVVPAVVGARKTVVKAAAKKKAPVKAAAKKPTAVKAAKKVKGASAKTKPVVKAASAKKTSAAVKAATAKKAPSVKAVATKAVAVGKTVAKAAVKAVEEEGASEGRR